MALKKRNSEASKKPKEKVPAVKVPAPFPRPQQSLEACEDGTELLRFVIPGRPATKKTHQRVVRRGGFTRILPSVQYMAYEERCKPYCEEVWKKEGGVPLDFGVKVIMRIYLDSWAGLGDHCGYAQSLGDIIQKFEIISDDKYIHWGEDGAHWFGGVDKVNPRAEIVIQRFRHPYEVFRENQEQAEIKKRERAAARLLKKEESCDHE